jgi:CarD family transcriptional regulator, regulator of rRNA transcription
MNESIEHCYSYFLWFVLNCHIIWYTYFVQVKALLVVDCHGWVIKKRIPMFNLGDRVVYPGHGVAKVNQIIKKILFGNVATFYELKFINKDMTILVPTNNQAAGGMRPLSSKDKIDDVFEFLAKPAKKVTHEIVTNWKQRNKEYQRKFRSGNLKEISEIYRELKEIERNKELSFCEKSLLQETELLLAQEIALVKKLEEDKALEQLRSFFSTIYTNRTGSITQKTI